MAERRKPVQMTRVAEMVAGRLALPDGRETVIAVFDVIGQLLATGQHVTLGNFGTFTVATLPARTFNTLPGREARTPSSEGSGP